MTVEINITDKGIQLKLIPEDIIESAIVKHFHNSANVGAKPTINGSAADYLTVTLDTPANARTAKIS